MSTPRNPRVTALALGLALLLGAMPLAAEAGGPVLEYLQGTIKPLLDSIAAAIAGVDGKVADSGRVRTVAIVIPTTESSSNVRNLDVAAANLGGWDKIRRYTVTIHWGSLRDAPAGVDSVVTRNCVTDNPVTFCTSLTVDNSDPAGSSGTMLDAYAGVNSFITVNRGADGLGPRDVLVNAYIEVEQ